MSKLRKAVKAVAIPVLQPLRSGVTWACQRGMLSSDVRRFFPGRWVLEPFTVYWKTWSAQWFPTEFDSVGHKIFWSGFREWEKETAPVILENIQRSRCFVDIGANCGIYTILGCTINPNLRVLAFEPVPKIFAALNNNVSRNGFVSRVITRNVAVGDCNKQLPFHESIDATMGSFDHSVTSDCLERSSKSNVER